MDGLRALIRRFTAMRPVAADLPPAIDPRLATSALRLLEVAHHADDVTFLVEAQDIRLWSEVPWSEGDVRGGVHILAPDGSTLDHDGPRSDAIGLRWAHLRPPAFSVSVPRDRLIGAWGVEIDVVVEGVAWGSDTGVPTLRVPLDVGRPPGAARRRSLGVTPWPAPLEDVVAELSSAWPEGADPATMRSYATTDAPRFLFTAQLVLASSPTRLLEIGANPYFTTRLLRGADPQMSIRGTNWFGTEPGPDEQKVVNEAGDLVATFAYDLVDVEAHAFPYEDGAFDLVLYGEVMEHLIADPVHALCEIHRVLEPGAVLILTTPNVARAENLVKLDTSRSIYDPYSSYGPHGRHNREYDASEIFELLEGNGFEPLRHFTRPVHGVTSTPREWFAAADDDGRGDYHFIEARRGRSCGPHRPSWLYR